MVVRQSYYELCIIALRTPKLMFLRFKLYGFMIVRFGKKTRGDVAKDFKSLTRLQQAYQI